MSTALIAVEGVLGEHSPIHGFYPIPGGVKLARSLRSEYRLVLGTTQSGTEGVEQWLRINGMVSPGFYDELVYRESNWDLDDAGVQARHALNLRSTGHDVALVISADPEAVLRVSQLGMPCLFFVNPAYRWAEYRPDRKRLPRPWQDIDDEIVRQRELRANDPRLNEMEDA